MAAAVAEPLLRPGMVSVVQTFGVRVNPHPHVRALVYEAAERETTARPHPTNTVSFHIRRSSPALRRRLRRVDASRVALSVVTEMELRYGLARNPKLKIAALVEEFLAGITVLPLDSEVAATYARVRVDLESRGQPIGPWTS